MEHQRLTFARWHPHLETEVLPNANAGHDAMNGTPLALARAVEQFLARW
jgi:hypothetical protein